MLGTVLLVLIVLALLGGFGNWGGRRPFYGSGCYGGGGLGLILVLLGQV